MKLVKLTFGVAGTLLIASFFAVPQLDAAPSKNTKARIHILTLECVLENINNGVTDIQYLTPEDCEEKVGPSPPLPVPEEKGEDILVTPVEEAVPPIAFQGTAGVKPQINDVQVEASSIGKLPTASPFVKGIVAAFYASVAAVAGVLILPAVFIVTRYGITLLVK